jgi:hypothetical protein
MSYINISKNMKGVHINWENNKIFPEYKYNSGPYVSQKRINKAIKIVIAILNEEEEKIKKGFKNLANKKYKGQNKTIKFNFDLAKKKVQNTKLSKNTDLIHGESNYYQIWISSNKLSDDELVGTILHESLHYIATFDNNEICEKDEHYVMSKLGDDC